MNKQVHYFLCFIFCFISTLAFSQQPTQEWARRYDGEGPTDDRLGSGNVIAVDAQGNSYVTGMRSNSNTGISNIVTVKYSPTGEELWVNIYDNGNSSQDPVIAIDHSGGVYITGTIVTAISGRVPIGYDFITIRYDAVTGKQSWVKQYDAQNTFDRAAAIAVDNTGGVYVTGTVYSSPYIYYSAQEFATVRYDAATGNETWAHRYDAGNTLERATDIVVDNSGGVFVTGTSGNNADGYDYLTIRYEATSGVRNWTNIYKTNNLFDLAVAITADNNDGVYITGTSTSAGTSYDFITIRYDATSGNQSWAEQYNSDNNGPEQAYAIAYDNAGGVYVTGTGADMSGFSDYITIRYETATGKQSWVQRYNGPSGSEDFATDIAVNNDGSVFVTGHSEGYFTTLSYQSSTGAKLWEARYNPTYRSAPAIAVSNKGGVFVTGISYGFIDGVDTSLDLATIRYVSSSGEEDWVQRYNGIGSLRDFSIAVTVDAAGNSYVTGTSLNLNTNFGSGTSSIVTIKYSPAGDSIWGQVYYAGPLYYEAQAIAVDNHGGVYVTGYIAQEGNRDKFITIRYDTDTGNERWVQEYRGDYTNWASDIAVDNAGGVYVTGMSGEELDDYDYITIRYDAVTGKQNWISSYKANTSFSLPTPIIAVDNSGGVYIAGATTTTTGWDLITVRYNSIDGEQSWAKLYDGGGSFERATDISFDNTSIYVTGISGSDNTGFDFITVSYKANSGEQRWDSRYKANTGSSFEGTAIAVDNAGGVYVTGKSVRPGTNFISDYATLRYDAATGKETWVQRYSGPNSRSNSPAAIAVDNMGSVYVTGFSGSTIGLSTFITFSTVKYATSDGKMLWDIQTAGPEDAAVDMALDSDGNIIVTGIRFGINTGHDFLTIKYSQQRNCPPLAAATLSGPPTALAGTSGSVYTLEIAGGTNFTWSITDISGKDHTSFTGQGTSSINVKWPSTPQVYKITVTYSGGESCSSQSATAYVHVSDPEAGFVTGGGWSTSPAHKAYELMQKEGKAHWSFSAKYKKQNVVEGSLLLKAEGFTFRSTHIDDGSLVIAGDKAYFRGQGTLTKKGNSGTEASDSRQFGFLLAATDAQALIQGKGHGKKNSIPDQLRILIWEINSDNTQGPVVYDNQIACSSGNGDYNAPACDAIEQGSIVIHRQGMKIARSDHALIAGETPEAQGMMVYPTHFSDRATVNFKLANGGEYLLELYDMRGVMVKRISAGSVAAGQRQEYEISAAGLAKGLYLLRLTSANELETVKLVVQR